MAKRIISGEDPDALVREGLTPEPQPWEDGLRLDTSRGNFEWWYFDAHFDDGSTFVVTMLTKPLLQRTDPLNPTIRLAITRPDGTQIVRAPVYPAGEFSASRDGCDVHIGPSWARGDLHSYELHAEAADLAADLVFTGVAPPWRPGAGVEYFDESRTRFFAWLPSIPFGRAEGTLTFDGQTHHVSGTGYHDHNWGNFDLNLGLSYWFWGRTHLADFTTIFVQMVATRKYGAEVLPIFMLARNDDLLADEGRFLTLRAAGSERHTSGKTYPRKLDFHWEKAGESVHLAMRQPEIIEATSLLTYLPTWKRLVGRLFANPYYFRFRADLDMTVNLLNMQAKEHGPVLYELMILH